MAGEPAIRKVAVALRATIASLESLTTAVIDRPEDEPFGNAELPAGNILHTNTTFELRTYNEQLHRATFAIDMIVSNDPDGSNAARLDELESDLIALLWANRTLGGLVEDIRPLSSEGNEQVRADDGARLLNIEILFVTPMGDHRTIIGPAGIVP